jgi:ATP-dependent helicase/nuclease subunit A
MNALKPLREAQMRASRPHDHAWVSASAGTGKTQVLTARVLRLLLAGAGPERILCLTFTKAAAAEMQTRIYERLARWVRIGDAELDGDLAALGEAPTPDIRDNARRLFAKALDARGGLRIQTLHSFAQSLLASFPVEAGVAPGFATLDDRSAVELRTRVLAETLTEAERSGDDAFARDIAELAVRLGEARLSVLAARLIAYRDGIRALGSPAGFEPLLRRRLGLPGEGPREEVLATTLGDGAFDCAGLRRFGAALGATGGVTAINIADAAARWLALDSRARLEAFDDLHAQFFTKDGNPKARLVPKKAADADPSLPDLADKLCADLAAVAELRARFDLVEVAAQHLRVGHRLAAAYQSHKARGGTLDFDDMIVRAADLLDRPGMAQWVRFKLDQSIDHILVDEGQDTNVHQWRIVHALAEEFFAGVGAREDAARTLFAVGDYKQAIFGFQGSDPRVFEDRRSSFRALADAAQTPFHDVPLAESFRSARVVLDVVDRVLDDLGPAALGLREAPERHVAARGDLPGRVVLWPAVVDEAHGGEAGSEPGELGWMLDTETRMARDLARQIRAWIDDPAMRLANGRRVEAQDILVLVRQRREFVAALVANLHAVRVPVAGVDRLRLTEPLAVQDLLALVRFALQPDDDLTLATLLVSPFIGWDQEALFDVAHARERGVTLWRRLRQHAERDAAAAQAVSWLGEVLGLADLKPPHEFFETILSGPLQGRARLLARLGEEARDSIEAVLAQALAFESGHAPSLQGFLAWIEADDIDLKRDPDAPLDAVRIMTVHGSKGLQAPIVVLADAARAPAGRGDDHAVMPWGPMGEEIPIFFGSRELCVGPIAECAAETARQAMEEHWRLLYVALTRAEDMLFVGGSLGLRDPAPGPDSWHAKVRAALEGLGAAAIEDPIWGDTLVYARGEAAAPTTAAAAHPPATEVPDWARTDPPPEASPPRPLTPSQLAEDDVASPPPSRREIDAARRGKLLHALFERLPAVPEGSRLEAAQKWLARQARDMDEAVRDELAYKALAVIDDPDFADLFGPEALAEAPVAAVVGTAVVAGQVDRLLVRPDRVQIVDFKTGLKVPTTAGEVSSYHLTQMAAYAAAVRRIFPGRAVEAALLFTETASLIVLPDDLLAAHAPKP